MVLRKYASIMAFVLVALFAMSSFASFSSAAYTHNDLTITLLLNGTDAATCTKDNPLVVTAGDGIAVDTSITNIGASVHLNGVTLKIYTIQTILFFDWEQKVHSELVYGSADIPAGATGSFTFACPYATSADVAGQKVRVDVIFDFETIDDYTVKFYVSFV